MVTSDWIKKGAVVIDVGINRVDAPERGAAKPGSPVMLISNLSQQRLLRSHLFPGSRPMTIACLLRNTMVSAARRRGVEVPASIG